ncbi:MAG TPA: hypothetical protein VKA21_12710 [Candidatus Binatia bacterium]|nr:hypothetical protein [Candidatus Binatia bacterium]
MTCSRCGEETTGLAPSHGALQDCLDFLRLSVTQLNLYVARAELEAQSARRRSETLLAILQEIADLARPELEPGVLPALVRRIKKLALEQTPARPKPILAR